MGGGGVKTVNPSRPTPLGPFLPREGLQRASGGLCPLGAAPVVQAQSGRRGGGGGTGLPPAHGLCSDYILASPYIKENRGVPHLRPRGKGLRLPGRPILGGAGQSFAPR